MSLAITILVSSEMFWRARGHRPSVVEDLPLWSYHRWLVGDEESQVVLLGASRIQVGFSTEKFHERFPSTPLAVLPVSGAMPMAALRDLAADESFRGTVICATTAPGFHASTWDQQQENVNHFHALSPSQLLEAAIKSRLQSRLVVLGPHVGLVRLLTAILRDGRLPAPSYIITKSDRSRIADYTLLDIQKHRQHRVELVQQAPREPSTYDQWENDAKEVGMLVKKIQDRGGKVVFVRFPTTDEHWEHDEQSYPKQVYWDRLARLTGAETIHFLDVPGLANFDCPDTSHLDCRDSPKFTAALLDELVKRGILEDN